MFDLLLLTCNLLRGLTIEVNVKSTVRFCIFEEKWNTVEPHSMDTRFIWTVLFDPTKGSYIFSKINPLYTDTG